MDTKANLQRTCDTCKYFSLRYYRANYTYFIDMRSGFCGIREFTEEEREKLPFGFACDKWAQKACARTDLSAIKDELSEITAKLIVIVKELSK